MLDTFNRLVNKEKCCPPPLGLNPQATEEEAVVLWSILGRPLGYLIFSLMALRGPYILVFVKGFRGQPSIVPLK